MKIEAMLAKEFKAAWVEGNVFYLQPKLNGHRMIWDGKKLWTRQAKEIVSVPGLISELEDLFPDIPLDGELYCHGMSFQEITKIGRRTVNIKDNKRLCMHIYDMPVKNLGFADRWYELTTKYGKTIQKSERLRLVETIGPVEADESDLENPQNLNIFRKEYEGTMLRLANGPYKFGKRSSDLLKIKKFHDAEALITGVTQYQTFEKIFVPKNTPGARKKSNGTYVKNGKGTLHEMMGALVCKLKNGSVFEIGSGFNHEERKQFWANPPIGQTVTFQYQEFSDGGIPIFPTYLRMKTDI